MGAIGAESEMIAQLVFKTDLFVVDAWRWSWMKNIKDPSELGAQLFGIKNS